MEVEEEDAEAKADARPTPAFDIADVDVPPSPLYKTEEDPIIRRVRGTVERVEEFVGEAGVVGTAEVEEVCKRAASAANSV